MSLLNTVTKTESEFFIPTHKPFYLLFTLLLSLNFLLLGKLFTANIHMFQLLEFGVQALPLGIFWLEILLLQHSAKQYLSTLVTTLLGAWLVFRLGENSTTTIDYVSLLPQLFLLKLAITGSWWLTTKHNSLSSIKYFLIGSVICNSVLLISFLLPITLKPLGLLLAFLLNAITLASSIHVQSNEPFLRKIQIWSPSKYVLLQTGFMGLAILGGKLLTIEYVDNVLLLSFGLGFLIWIQFTHVLKDITTKNLHTQYLFTSLILIILSLYTAVFANLQLMVARANLYTLMIALGLIQLTWLFLQPKINTYHHILFAIALFLLIPITRNLPLEYVLGIIGLGLVVILCLEKLGAKAQTTTRERSLIVRDSKRTLSRR